MPQEIHITVPKGAKVIIHEEDEPEVERTLEERVEELEKALEAAPERVYIPMPYPVYPAPVYYPPLLVPYPAPTWDQPYTVTSGISSVTSFPNSQSSITIN